MNTPTKILVVDDEQDVVDLFRQRFRRELRNGSVCLEFAHCAEDALVRVGEIERPRVMLILSDINMPGMSGLELLKSVKERWANLPVVMVTAYGDEENRRRATELGAEDLIAKPIDFDALKARLAALAEA
ncbi:MAG TPA: response regulator [Azospirillaceae bacterium]|nr:response regulator [Azospirillaceae bacterium]